MVELQLFFHQPLMPPCLHLLRSFSVPALLAASADQATLICVCCQASPSLLIFAAYADEAAVKSATVVLAAALLAILAVQALLQRLLM